MPLDILSEFISAAILLLRLGIITAIPCFPAVLIGERLHNKISKRFSLSWIKATLLSTYLIVTLLIIFLYLVPLYYGWIESPLTGEALPPELQPGLFDLASLFLLSAVKILLAALVYTILLLPFMFFATYVLEKLKDYFKRYINYEEAREVDY